MTLSPGDIVWAWHVESEDGPKQYEVKEHRCHIDNTVEHRLHRVGGEGWEWVMPGRFHHIYPTKAEATDAYEQAAKARYKAVMATVRRLRKEAGDG